MNYLDYQKITPNMLEQAMVHFGWSKIKTYPNKKAVWASESGMAKQWLPQDDSFADYDQSVAEAIESIARHSSFTVSDVEQYFNQFFHNKDLI